MRVPATVALAAAAVVSDVAFLSDVHAAIDREATTKHTKSTKGIARQSQPSIAVLFFEVKLTSRLEDVAARAVPPEMQFFVLFVCFVVASS
jgi:hypothetical protein